MRKTAIFTTLFISILANVSLGQTTTIDFETAGSGYTPSTTTGSGTTDVFNRVDVTNFGGNSSFIWAAEDISGDPSITLDQIDVTGSKLFTLSVDFLTPNSNNWDSTDELLITFSVDGGSYQNLMWVQADNDDNYNEPAQLDLDFDGEGDDGQDLPAITDGHGAGVGSDFATFTSSSFSLNSNTTLDIKLQFNNLTTNDEGIYIDNIVITESSDIPDLMISEVADPSDAYLARFIELYNASGSIINFSSQTWYLCRQTNGGATWEDKQLTGSISAGDIYISANNNDDENDDFYLTFGFMADFNFGGSSGNGDDGYFLYYGGDHTSGTLVDAYGVIDEDGTGKTWEYEDSHAVRKAGTTEPNSTWTASEWTINSATAAQCGPTDTSLPVELISFTARVERGAVILEWVTESEIENLGFLLERWSNGGMEEWVEIANYIDNPELQGQGSVTYSTEYTFTDKMVETGETYDYRLADVSYDGVVEYHSMTVMGIEVGTMPETFALQPAYPNPFNPATIISYNLIEDGNVTLTIFDINGREVSRLVEEIQSSGEYELFWDASHVSSGVYFCRLVQRNQTATQKLIYLK